jgi:hypothetical protein
MTTASGVNVASEGTKGTSVILSTAETPLRPTRNNRGEKP